MDRIIRILNSIKSKLRNDYALSSFLVFIFIFALLSFMYIPNRGIIAIDDHFFHFKIAENIKENGFESLRDFDNIYLTRTASDGDKYAVSLFNLSLVPFTYISDPILALKISDVFWLSLSLAFLFIALRKLKIKHPFLWILLLLSVNFFVMRMLIGRAFVMSIPFFLFEIYFAVNRRWRSFLLLSFLHVFWHQSSFFVPLLVASVVEVARYLHSYTFFWKNLLASILAAVAAMLYFPELAKGLLSVQLAANDNERFNIEGIELKVHDIFDIYGTERIAFLLLILSVSFALFIYIRMKRDEFTDQSDAKNNIIFLFVFSIFSLLFLFGTISVSGRFYDFYFPSVIFFSAIALSIAFDSGIITCSSYFRKYFLIAISIFLTFGVVNNLLLRNQIISNNDYRPIGEAAQWVSNRSDGSQKIFLHTWNHFPVSFFYNDKDIYTMGIEPIALYDYNEDLYWKWYNIFVHNIYCDIPIDCIEQKNNFDKKLMAIDEKDREKAVSENYRKMINSIKNDFGAKYIIGLNGMGQMAESNMDMVSEMSKFESEYNGSIIYAIELK